MENDIKPPKFYKPMEAAELGMIVNYTNSNNVMSNYQFILGLIKDGKLKAKDVSKGKIPHWVISSDEIKRYNDELLNF